MNVYATAIRVKDIDYWIENSNMIVYTGMVDELLHYDLGVLGYRSLKFETQLIQNVSDYQGIAVVNELNKEIPYTRTVEHRHITPDFVPYHKSPTIITREFPLSWSIGQEAYYPICDTQNKQLYLSYREFLRHKYPSIHLGGRLGNFQYYDMDDAIQDALTSFPTISASLRLV